MASFASLSEKVLLNDALLNDEILLSDEQLLIKEKCENSFYDFVVNAWQTLENRDFIEGWHVHALCEHLQATFEGTIRKLIVNLPPRTGKSNIISVLFPAWCWTKDPGLRFLYTAYAQVLSVRDSVACRRLIQSSWYDSLWGNKFKLMGDVNNKLRFDNNKSGYRIASSAGGSNTGLGGDFVVCFPYETMITTDQGDIPIGKIVEENMDVLGMSYNHQQNMWEYKPILKKMKSKTQELIEIKFEDGKTIYCTPDHPIWIEGKGYVRAEDLQTEESCFTV